MIGKAPEAHVESHGVVSRALPWRSLASLTLQLTVLAALLAAFFLRTQPVSGLSMEPEIASGEFVLINTAAFRLANPKRGDIVIFRHDEGTPEVFIKRIVGLPGDRVRVDRGTVSLNGRPLDEPYVRFRDDRSFPEVTVPPGSFYVLGDNRANSEDSRFFGPVPYDSISGKAVAGIWPAGRFGAL